MGGGLALFAEPWACCVSCGAPAVPSERGADGLGGLAGFRRGAEEAAPLLPGWEGDPGSERIWVPAEPSRLPRRGPGKGGARRLGVIFPLWMGCSFLQSKMKITVTL